MTSDPLQLKLRAERDHDDTTALAQALTTAIWGTPSAIDPGQTQSFLRYWDSHCSLIDSENAIVKSHQDVLDIGAVVRDDQASNLDTLRRNISNRRPNWLGKTDDASERAIELSVRLWLFVEIEDWDDAMTLPDFIDECCLPSVPLTEELILPGTFNAQTLEMIWRIPYPADRLPCRAPLY